MRWILCGKNDPAVRCLEFLVARGDEILVVATAGDDGTDAWQRSLAGAARALGVGMERPAHINAEAFVAKLAAFGAHALVSIQYDQILKAPLLEGIGCPCLNLHFALLPRHRGVSPIAWAIALGDREAGVTLHHMAAAIDAGDVIAQRALPIPPDGTARELYDALSQAAVDLFCESYPFSDDLLALRLPQNPADASYHRAGEFDFSLRNADWTRPAAELHSWLRAMIFPPHQYPVLKWRGRTLGIARVGKSVEPAERGGALAGTVLACSPREIRVAASGGTLSIRALVDESGAPLDLHGFARSSAVGEVLTGS